MADNVWPRAGAEWEAYLKMTPEEIEAREKIELQKWFDKAPGQYDVRSGDPFDDDTERDYARTAPQSSKGSPV